MSHTEAHSSSAKAGTTELSAAGLEIWRGETRLLRNFGFQLSSGETLWLRGPNGAGKTTLMRVILGLSQADAGEVHWCGRPRDEDRSAFLADVAWCGHQTGLRPELSPRENLASWQPLAGRRSARRLSDCLERLALTAVADRPCAFLSAGQQKRASLARLLLCEASLWCLDEPLTSLDADGQTLVGELILEHRSHGGACLVSSHQPLPDSAGTVRELDLDRSHKAGGGGA
ncbi:cytochrome c biogenesis heme-transporting ATPase CcmA [Gammaproteobacteria bacterium AB-CW1]|uniref:Cytochrome c biogenesis heme-transporting ATPase CcmA n=1 Tax=Natronospira elongata TaxID=3110268 RepID=A0AAP6JE41_9GAMM|nr:cytochrome c biogenesis heme-transporting ATPase CcmA [Gammaproteobacteria bacterium AB-CW1]